MVSTLELVQQRLLTESGIDQLELWLCDNYHLVSDVANLIIEFTDIFCVQIAKKCAVLEKISSYEVNSAQYLYVNLLAYLKAIEFEFNTPDPDFNQQMNNLHNYRQMGKLIEYNNRQYLKRGLVDYLLKKFKINTDYPMAPLDNNHLKLLMLPFVEFINVPIFICNYEINPLDEYKRTLHSILFVPKNCDNFIHAYIEFDGNIPEMNFDEDDDRGEMRFEIMDSKHWIFPTIPLPDQNILPTDINKYKLTLMDHELDVNEQGTCSSVEILSDCPFYQNYMNYPTAIKKMEEYIIDAKERIDDMRSHLDEKQQFIKAIGQSFNIKI